jgi:hypothetical protein
MILVNVGAELDWKQRKTAYTRLRLGDPKQYYANCSCDRDCAVCYCADAQCENMEPQCVFCVTEHCVNVHKEVTDYSFKFVNDNVHLTMTTHARDKARLWSHDMLQTLGMQNADRIYSALFDHYHYGCRLSVPTTANPPNQQLRFLFDPPMPDLAYLRKDTKNDDFSNACSSCCSDKRERDKCCQDACDMLCLFILLS